MNTTTAASSAVSAVPLYWQCGGINWTGATECAPGAYCTSQNPYYYQCVAGTATSSIAFAEPTTTWTTTTRLSVTRTVRPGAPTLSGSVAPSSNSSAMQTTSVISLPSVSSTSAPQNQTINTMKAVKSSSTVTSSSSTSSSAASSSATSGRGAEYAGINIAGFDFGCSTDGTCTVSGAVPPRDGAAQMKHFYNDDKLNAFRLPVGWQYLVNGKLGGDLDSTNFAAYDSLVHDCLATGAMCVIDMHNYGRWNGQIIGQGGPTNDQFADIWSQLATHYANESNVWFGIMNEPHDVTVSTWADTVQAAVTAIRNAGAKVQYISLPGSDWQSASSFISGGSAAALLDITNPDGTTDKLIFDVHKYLDSGNTGTSRECVTDNIDAAFAPLADWLRKNKRQALVSETGGGNTASCEKYLCQELAYLNKNSDVYLAWTAWSAGSFASSYELGLTPSGSTDTSLVTACISRA